jgi:hypothetical protein
VQGNAQHADTTMGKLKPSLNSQGRLTCISGTGLTALDLAAGDCQGCMLCKLYSS